MLRVILTHPTELPQWIQAFAQELKLKGNHD